MTLQSHQKDVLDGKWRKNGKDRHNKNALKKCSPESMFIDFREREMEGIMKGETQGGREEQGG